MSDENWPPIEINEIWLVRRNVLTSERLVSRWSNFCVLRDSKKHRDTVKFWILSNTCIALTTCQWPASLSSADYYVAVYLPGHFFHLLNIQHPDLICHSLFSTGMAVVFLPQHGPYGFVLTLLFMFG